MCHAGGLNNIAGEEKHTLKRDALEQYGLYDLEAITTQVHLIAISQVLTSAAAGAAGCWLQAADFAGWH